MSSESISDILVGRWGPAPLPLDGAVDCAARRQISTHRERKRERGCTASQHIESRNGEDPRSARADGMYQADTVWNEHHSYRHWYDQWSAAPSLGRGATVMVLITTFTSIPCSIPSSAFYMQPLILIEPMIGTSNNIIIIYIIIIPW